jgi:type IX secretion system substrate protein
MMKRFFLIISIICINNIFLGQKGLCWNYFDINFEDTTCLGNISIDTFSNPNNIWQIGQPRKTMFDSAWSFPNALATDTIKPYPINDTSIFIFTNIADVGFTAPHAVELSCYYYVNSDTLNDYGLIEFSPDNGNTWIDLIHDTLYSSYIDWNTDKPVLTGNSDGWKYFHVSLGYLGPVFNINRRDTVLYRFSFISDSIPDSLDGLMYDDIHYADYFLGIEENSYKKVLSKAYPNPTDIELTIEFENPKYIPFQLFIYDNHGRQVFEMDELTDSKIVIDIKGFQSGIYFYKLINNINRQRAWGKFIVSRN